MQELAGNFVAVADELHQLRKGTTPEAKFFQKVFAQKERHPGHQGVFLATPGGRLLASSTCYEAEQVVNLLNKGLAAWNELSTQQRLEPKSELVDLTAAGRPEDRYPENGLVLRITTRDLPGTGLEGLRNPRWHRYFLWFNQDEVTSMLPDQLEVGKQHMMPANLANRVAALALLDKGNVDGFTRPFREKDIELAEILLTVSDVDDNKISFRISGETFSKTPDAQAFVSNMPRYENIPDFRGLRTRIVGTASWDPTQNRFTKFRMIAAGTRFGGAYVGREPDDWDEHPIGFSIVIGQGTSTERIAPEFPHRYPWLGQTQPSEIRFADSGQGLGGRDDKGLPVGENAADFRTRLLDSNGPADAEVSFLSLIDRRPVVLAFGSYT